MEDYYIDDYHGKPDQLKKYYVDFIQTNALSWDIHRSIDAELQGFSNCLYLNPSTVQKIIRSLRKRLQEVNMRDFVKRENSALYRSAQNNRDRQNIIDLDSDEDTENEKSTDTEGSVDNEDEYIEVRKSLRRELQRTFLKKNKICSLATDIDNINRTIHTVRDKLVKESEVVYAIESDIIDAIERVIDVKSDLEIVWEIICCRSKKHAWKRLWPFFFLKSTATIAIVSSLLLYYFYKKPFYFTV